MLAAVTSALAFQGPASFKVDSKVVAQSAAAAVTFAALPAFAGDAAAGESVFSGNCAACHAGGQNVIMPEKTLQQEALEEYLDGGANVAAVVKQVGARPPRAVPRAFASASLPARARALKKTHRPSLDPNRR
jgi:cytochrome c6